MPDPGRPPRRKPTLRLQGHDYSQPGQYFVTLCVAGRARLLGNVVESLVDLTPLGKFVASAWTRIPESAKGVALDAFVVMPNHLHGILVLGAESETGTEPPAPVPLWQLIRAFKRETTFELRRRDGLRESLWQTRYHDHIVRNDKDLERIRHYIAMNPERWPEDEFWTP